ncbi:MAG: acyl-CoA dehydrogenase family protein [Actinomyces sp.]|jgi:alkylation response protein AidB-like acyl-CoA dehydrogenase|nr:acyl-CoA dehydrogenase family protein [Actinomyces sp.]MCI1788518.1 acyl-CoA dehydrogenase family protein [Actinomyces sp.]
MSYFLNDDQRMLQSVAREFAREEVRKRAVEIDQSNIFPQDLYRRAGELGFLGVLLPEAVGGSAAGPTAAGVICEEVAKESTAFALSLYVSMAIPTYLLRAPDTRLAARYLPDLVAGAKVPSAALTFPVGSTNFAEWPVFATRDGDDWVLNGTKLFVTNTGAADIIIAVGFTEDREIGCFVVEKGADGLDDSHVERKMGLNGNSSGTYVFSGVRVPRSHFFVMSLESMGLGNALCAASALGCAEGAWQRTVDYMKVRTRAKRPLIEKQVVAHRLARMYGEIERSRALVYEALALADRALAALRTFGGGHGVSPPAARSMRRR